MKALVTGLSGFSGRYLKRELEENGYEVFGLYQQSDTGEQRVDIRDAEKVRSVVKEVKPDAVFHLAAQAVASKSWKIPQDTLMINAVGTVNLLEALRLEAPHARVLLVGSSDQYGTPDPGLSAISEESPLNPRTPYGVSKCVQEWLGKVYASAYGMEVCMTRTFSFGGAGQPEGFVLSDFAHGVAAVEAGIADSIKVGNLNSERDFTHIKDVVRAYRLLNEEGEPGETYNVGSGNLYGIQNALDDLIRLASVEIPVIHSDAKRRPADVHGAACNHDKLTNLTGWQPELSFNTILEDELRECRHRIYAEEKNMHNNEKIFTGGGEVTYSSFIILLKNLEIQYFAPLPHIKLNIQNIEKISVPFGRKADISIAADLSSGRPLEKSGLRAPEGTLDTFMDFVYAA